MSKPSSMLLASILIFVVCVARGAIQTAAPEAARSAARAELDVPAAGSSTALEAGIFDVPINDFVTGSYHTELHHREAAFEIVVPEPGTYALGAAVAALAACFLPGFRRRRGNRRSAG